MEDVCVGVVVVVRRDSCCIGTGSPRRSGPAISSKPDTPFKLATFEAAGRTRIGLVLGNRVIDIPGANAELVATSGVRPCRCRPRCAR